MISLFLSFAISDSVVNRDFINGDPNFTGSWEYGGKAGYFGDSFYLGKNAPKSYAGIYQTSYLSGNFSFEVSFVFEDATAENPSNAGIWITKDYHQQSIVFGGPLSFDGVALMMVYNGSKLCTEFRKNDRRGRFTSYQYFPTSFVQLENGSVKIRFEYRSGVCNVTMFTGNRSVPAFNDVSLSNLNKYYLSVTTKNSKKPNSLLVKSVFVSKNPDEDFSPIIPQKVVFIHEFDENMTSAKPRPTQMPPLVTTSQAKADDVLDEILEFNLLSDGSLTKASDVRSMLWKEILPFSDRWQRRSVRINRQTLQFRKNITDVLKFSHDQFKLVNDDIIKYLDEIKGSINEVSSELFYGINGNLELNNDIKTVKNEGIHNITEVLMYIGIVELCAVAVVFIIKIVTEKAVHA